MPVSPTLLLSAHSTPGCMRIRHVLKRILHQNTVSSCSFGLLFPLRQWQTRRRLYLGCMSECCCAFSVVARCCVVASEGCNRRF